MKNFIQKYWSQISTLIFGIFVGYLLFSSSKTITETREVKVDVIKHDTVSVIKYVDKIKYEKVLVKEKEYIKMIDSTQIDSMYKEFAEKVKLGEIPVATDSVHFGKNFLQTKYKFPPISKFEYDFVEAPDTIITNTIKKTITIDKTPKLSFFIGGNYIKSTSNYGFHAGVKIRNIGISYGIFKDHNNIGLSYYWPR